MVAREKRHQPQEMVRDGARSPPPDDLAAPAYDSLTQSEFDKLIVDLEPISAALDAAGSR